MKRISLVAILIFSTFLAFGQVLPSFQFGLKGGANLSKFSTENTFGSDNRAGYYVGVWTRIGAAGIHLQPELYLSGKNTTLKSGGLESDVKFTSLDVPVLVGTKIGAAGIGVRLNTGPVVSFILNDEQSFGDAASNVFSGSFKDQAFAWQFGTGLDVGKLSVDLRYEMGLSKLNDAGYPDTKLNMFTLGLGLRLF
ncbi:porin family protein [Pedobacter xixiisoli]|uniref:Outer membrane protein beta-barrel domain-containing protein n=1 Tax=Pedobacter xixiisoli TaxID=1476464 RepID=A0A285ZZZ3_9SPHI|nr:porin family protein [Pedobacter xixiisoli]SOD15217.1 Outer membrane protein beta-barrel domain-containing protein [Pedobacter xixiisoli]